MCGVKIVLYLDVCHANTISAGDVSKNGGFLKLSQKKVYSMLILNKIINRIRSRIEYFHPREDFVSNIDDKTVWFMCNRHGAVRSTSDEYRYSKWTGQTYARVECGCNAITVDRKILKTPMGYYTRDEITGIIKTYRGGICGPCPAMHPSMIKKLENICAPPAEQV